MNGDTPIERQLEAKRLAVEFVARTIDDIDNFDLNDPESCFARFEEMLGETIAPEMHAAVLREIKKVVNDLIDSAVEEMKGAPQTMPIKRIPGDRAMYSCYIQKIDPK